MRRRKPRSHSGKHPISAILSLVPKENLLKKQNLALLQTWHCDDEQTLEEASEEQMEEMGTGMEASAGDD